MVADTLAQAVHRLVADGAPEADADLIGRFVATRDESAFALLVRRYGPMVFGVCSRTLGHQQDAEDAFQATFLVFARKAHAIRGESVGRWLYGVAVRVAKNARVRRARQMTAPVSIELLAAPAAPPATNDWLPLLDAAIARLSDRDRGPIVLCDLLGRSRTEAAAELGVAEGTLSSRLARAREKLRKKLTRLGAALSLPTLAAGLADQVVATVPPSLFESTIAVGASAAAAHQLAEGVMQTMFLAKFLKLSALSVFVLGTVTAGVLWLPATGADQVSSGKEAPPAKASPPKVDTDQQRIQGTWVIESVVAPNDRAGVEGLNVDWKTTKGWFVTFRSDQLEFALFPAAIAVFHLDPAHDPKAIDFTFRNLLSAASVRRVFESKRPGIYEFVGEQLRIAIGDPDRRDRPVSLEPDGPRPQSVYLTLRRPNADEQKRLEKNAPNRLDGTWNGVLETVRGQERPAGPELKLLVTGDQLQFDVPGTTPLHATFRVDSKKSPWHIDLTATQDGGGVKKGAKLMGIVTATGRFLNLAIGSAERPTSFESAGKNGAYLLAQWMTQREATDLLRLSPDSAKAAPKQANQRLRDLRLERIKSLEEQLDGAFERVKIGKDPLIQYTELIRELGTAELDLAETKDAKIAAAEKMLRLYALCETQVSELHAAGLQTKQGVAQARAARLKAEIQLDMLKLQ
jgi:RNA polymerase sigma factor (sigma-70 family)